MSDEAVSRAVHELRKVGIDPVEFALRAARLEGHDAPHVEVAYRVMRLFGAPHGDKGIIGAPTAAAFLQNVADRLVRDRIDERGSSATIRVAVGDPLYDTAPFASGAPGIPMPVPLFRNFASYAPQNAPTVSGAYVVPPLPHRTFPATQVRQPSTTEGGSNG